MSFKDTLILGAVGAAGIYVARKIPGVESTMDKVAPTNNKALPLIPPEFMSRNSWSFAFVALPAIGAWYLSR